MSTKIRAEVSKKNEYWIEKHRYYELKHFCLQYPIWRQAYVALESLGGRPKDLAAFSKGNSNADPTAKCAEARMFYSERMSMLEKVAKETDEVLWIYILKGVTEGCSYGTLRTKDNIPCCKDTYYKLQRKFYWLLNKVRN